MTIFWCIQQYVGSIFHFPTTFFHDFSENVLPARVGSTILTIATTHFKSKISIFRPRSGSNRAHVGDGLRPYRSVVRSFPLLSPPCLPSWTSKNVANMCIIATSGLLERLQPCIRHHFNDILMCPTSFWRYFGVSNVIFYRFWRIWRYLGDIWTKIDVKSI